MTLKMSKAGRQHIDAKAAADALAPALAQASGLVGLLMGGYAFGPQGAWWLVPTMSALPNLRLGGIDFGPQGPQF